MSPRRPTDNHLSPRSRRVAFARRASRVCLLGALAAYGSGCELLLGDIPEDQAQTDARVEGPDADSGTILTPPGQPEFTLDADVDAAREDAATPSEPRDGGEPRDAATTDPDAGGEPTDGAAPDEPDAGGALDAGGELDAGSVAEDAGGTEDAGSIEDAGPPCTPSTWYADLDGDTYGNGSKTTSACSKPPGAWVARAGDCADNNGSVFPGQVEYFGRAYTTPGGSESFDYDCSGTETERANQALAPKSCALLANACSGKPGYAPTSRSGSGVNAYCGSTSITSCTPDLSFAFCKATSSPTADPFLCH